jgi:hypothetical protein
MGRERAGLRVSWRKKMSRDRGQRAGERSFRKMGYSRV